MLKKFGGKVLFQFLILLLLTFCSTGAFASDTGFIPAAHRKDMVYDDARGILYITNGSSVLRYQLATSSFLTPYTFNPGNLSGIDISPDGNTLAIADRSITGIRLVDLRNDTPSDILFTATSGESGTFSVAFGADGALLVSSSFAGSGWVPLRRVDPVTRTVSVVQSDAMAFGEISQDAMLSASSDRSCIAYVEGNISSGPLSIYNVASKTVTRTVRTEWFTYEVGANRNCTQFAVPTYGGTFIYDGGLNKLGTVGVYAGGSPIGAAYHPSQDIVYFPWTGSSRVWAFDSSTSQQLASFDVKYQFQHTGNSAYTGGRIKTSRNGSLLFVTVEGGVYSVKTALNPVGNSQSLATNSSNGVAVTLTGTSPKGAGLSYSIVTQPTHGTLQGTPPNVTYIPQAGFSGTDSFTFKASDGVLESGPATISITVDREAPAVAAFALPANSSFLSVSFTSFSATDNVGVTGYCLSESASPSACQWSATPPASYRFSGIGTHTLYAYARDAAGNVSDAASAAVAIPEIVPRITAFSIPPTHGYNELSVRVTLTATDDLGVTDYCITESDDPAGCNWTGWAPYEYTLAAAGPRTLYAFARNSAGKVSAPAQASTNVVGKVNFIPALDRVDTAYDTARGVVYITSGPSVLRYHIGTQSFLTSYTFPYAHLMGIDISPDGNTLAVADSSMVGVRLVDLRSNVQSDLLFTPSSGESGSYSVAFGADGALLVSARFSGSGWVPLRRVDPATRAVSVVQGVGLHGQIRQDSMLSASGDRKCIAYEESNISSGPVGIYHVASKAVTTVGTDRFNYEVAANRDCTQFAVPTYGGTFIYDSNLTKIGTVGTYADKQPIGGAYSPVADVVYFPWTGTREVRSYDTKSYQQAASYDMGYTFEHNGNHAYQNGRLKVSSDGGLFLVTVDGGVRYQRIGSGGAPVADDQALSAFSGSPIAVTLTGSSAGQSPLSYSVTVQPSHGTLEGTAPHLTYTPAAGYSGPDSFSFKVSDGSRESNTATFAISVKGIPTNVAVAAPTAKGSLSLSWSNPSDAGFSHIHIYRSSSAGTLGTLIADNLTGSSYTDSGLASFTTYYYTVRRVDEGGMESKNIAQVSRRTLDATPPLTVATPPQGRYGAPVSVTLSCNDGGEGCAATYYCLGSTCSPESAYTSAVTISSSTQLRVYSVDKAGNRELVKNANYQIEPRFLTVSPESVNMGAGLFYYPIAKVVTISNQGSLPVTASAPITITGPDAAQFRVNPGGPSPCSSLTPTLAAGTSCTVNVSFTPESAGLKQAYLQIASNADNAPEITVSFTGMGLPPVYLTTHITGVGSVNNLAPSSGFSCASSVCTAPYAAGSSVILRATPASAYTFTGWSGGSCSGTDDCELTLTSSTTVAASFAGPYLVRVTGSSASYPTFSAALLTASGSVLRSRNLVITDDIHLTSPRTLTLIGGLRGDFATREGATVLEGTIKIRGGCLKVRDLVLR